MKHDREVRKPPTRKRGEWCPNRDWVKEGGRGKKFRCPTCKHRLLPKPIHCVGGELVGWRVPAHKTR